MFAHRLAVAILSLMTLTCPSLAKEGLEFQGWELPAKATVTVGGSIKGHRMKLRYQLELSKVDMDLKLAFSDVTILEMDGQNRDSPGFIEDAKLAERAMGNSLPDLRISLQGECIGLFDWNGWADSFVEEFYDFAKNRTKKEKAELRSRMEHPLVRQLSIAKMTEAWQTWVGMWRGIQIPLGETVRVSVKRPIGDVLVESLDQVEHLGRDENGKLQLRMTTFLDGDRFGEAVAAIVAELPDADSIVGGADGVAIPQVYVERSYTLLTDSATLRPEHVKVATKVVARHAGKDVDRTDTVSYDFQWKD